MPRRKVVFEHDTDPDFSWLEQEQYNPSHPTYDPIYRSRADMRAKRNAIDGDWYRDPENHVALCMLVYEQCGTCDEWKLVDSLGNIDFIAAWDDWTTGEFYYVSDIPKHAKYLRSLAREAKLGYRPRARKHV